MQITAGHAHVQAVPQMTYASYAQDVQVASSSSSSSSLLSKAFGSLDLFH
jgi:hypothetical protein